MKSIDNLFYGRCKKELKKKQEFLKKLQRNIDLKKLELKKLEKRLIPFINKQKKLKESIKKIEGEVMKLKKDKRLEEEIKKFNVIYSKKKK